MRASGVFRQSLHAIVLDHPAMMRICLEEYAYQHAERQIFDAGLPSAIAARDVFMQVHLNYDDPITDGYVCNALNVLLDDDNAAMFAVHVGATPHMDAQRRLNAALLADLPEPFFCCLDIGRNECDALLSWDSAHHRPRIHCIASFSRYAACLWRLGDLTQKPSTFTHCVREGSRADHMVRSGFMFTDAGCSIVCNSPLDFRCNRVIMAQAGHKSADMVRRYIREGSLFRENVAAEVGL